MALWLRQRFSAPRSVLGGLAAAALVFVIVYVVALDSGLMALSAVAPVLVVIAAEFTLGLSLRRARVRRSI